MATTIYRIDSKAAIAASQRSEREYDEAVMKWNAAADLEESAFALVLTARGAEHRHCELAPNPKNCALAVAALSATVANHGNRKNQELKAHIESLTRGSEALRNAEAALDATLAYEKCLESL